MVRRYRPCRLHHVSSVSIQQSIDTYTNVVSVAVFRFLYQSSDSTQKLKTYYSLLELTAKPVIMDKWVNRRRTQQQGECSCRLFCFPWAGGGTGLYSSWAKYIPGNVEVNAMCLPGRESRFKETPYSDLSLLVEDLCTVMLPSLRDKPFALLGHSMGAIICFELACYLKTHHGLEPTHMFLSGATAPYSTVRQEKVTDKPLDQLTDDDFIARLVRIGGTPKEVLTKPALMKMFIPCIKADLMMLENYSKEAPSDPVLSCPINFFDGADDKTKKHDIESWRTVTSGPFEAQLLPGGHFFLQEEKNAGVIIRCIADNLKAS